MRYTITIIIIILIGFPLGLVAQTIDKYKVLLNRENVKKFEIYDTTISIDYLSKVNSGSLTNMQLFEGFDYATFKRKANKDVTTLYNDSIQIRINTIPFDSVRFIKHYQMDSSVYYNSLYFRDIPADFNYPPYFPKTEVSEIAIIINKKTIKIPRLYSKALYNPTIDCWSNNGNRMCGVNGYVADNGKILLTMNCGEGAGAYMVIFIFDQTGKIEKRIEEPLI